MVLVTFGTKYDDAQDANSAGKRPTDLSVGAIFIMLHVLPRLSVVMFAHDGERY